MGGARYSHRIGVTWLGTRTLLGWCTTFAALWCHHWNLLMSFRGNDSLPSSSYPRCLPSAAYSTSHGSYNSRLTDKNGDSSLVSNFGDQHGSLYHCPSPRMEHKLSMSQDDMPNCVHSSGTRKSDQLCFKYVFPNYDPRSEKELRMVLSRGKYDFGHRFFHPSNGLKII